jgi:hypothetical protein
MSWKSPLLVKVGGSLSAALSRKLPSRCSTIDGDGQLAGWWQSGKLWRSDSSVFS